MIKLKPTETKVPNRVIWGVIVILLAVILIVVLVFIAFRKPSQYQSVIYQNQIAANNNAVLVLNQFTSN
jgi:hypothetical protein